MEDQAQQPHPDGSGNTGSSAADGTGSYSNNSNEESDLDYPGLHLNGGRIIVNNIEDVDPNIPLQINFKGRKSYSVALKRKAVAELTTVFDGNKSACAKAHNITTKMLRSWQQLEPAMASVREDRRQTLKRVSLLPFLD